MRLGQFKPTQKENGLAIVEFVIVAPVMLLLMIAVAEFGRAFYQYNMLVKAVESGVRHYARTETLYQGNSLLPNPESEDETKNLVVYGSTTPAADAGTLLEGLTPDMVAISLAGEDATVTASYPFQPLPGDPLAGLLGLFGSAGITSSLTLSAASSMKVI